MPTLILTPRYTPDSQRLWRAVPSLGWDVERLTSWRVPEHLKQLAEPVLYVEALFAQVVAAEFGVELKEPPEDWLPRLPDAFRKRAVVLTTLGKARGLAFPAFVKPPNDKCFPARVCASATDLPTDFPDDLPVLVSEVVTWEKEYRCFAVDARVATASVYLRDGVLQADNDFVSEPAELAEATAFAEDVLLATSMIEPIVIDVGVIRGRGWAVVEVNACWGSGIYGCDPVAVLKVLQRACVRRPQATELGE